MSVTIGNVLKEARSKKSVSLDEVHAKIKIHPRVLQILEDGRFEKLPGPVYVKSFLKSYADFLEVNGDDLVKTYEKEEVRAPEQAIYLRTADERLTQSAKYPHILSIVFGVLVVAAFAVSIFYVIKVSGRWQSKEGVSAKAAVSRTQTVALPGPMTRSSESSGMLRSVAQGNFPVIGKETPMELKLKASDNVWLRITCDGKVLFQSILKRGMREIWVAQKSIEVWSGNSANTTLWLNDAPLGSPGKGSAKKIRITREGIEKIA